MGYNPWDRVPGCFRPWTVNQGPPNVSPVPRSPITPEQLALGTQVRVARKQAGLAQERLAAIAGIDRAYVGEIERGRANPSLKTMWKLARAIGVHPREFFRDDPEDYETLTNQPSA